MTSQGGSTDLASLLRTMKPVLSSSIFLFCNIPFDKEKEKLGESSALPEIPKDVFVQCIFREEEGWSLVIKEDKHIALSGEERKVGGESRWGDLWTGLKPQYEDQSNRWSLITLNVHSSLLAVGFIAAVSERFGKEGIPCNVVAGYFHDHVFVPVEKAGLAVEVLEKLSRGE